jgi:hypothetical protein
MAEEGPVVVMSAVQTLSDTDDVAKEREVGNGVCCTAVGRRGRPAGPPAADLAGEAGLDADVAERLDALRETAWRRPERSAGMPDGQSAERASPRDQGV